MLPEYATYTGAPLVSDEQHGQHFGHHAHFARRYPGRWWVYQYARVPLGKLVCKYPSIGENNHCPGLLSEIGREPVHLVDVALLEIAAWLREAWKPNMTVRQGCSLDRIRTFRVLSKLDLENHPQAIMVLLRPESAVLVEGNHRCLALALNDESDVNAVLFDKIQLRPE